jgi:pyrroline-5-carboxylate reductase
VRTVFEEEVMKSIGFVGAGRVASILLGGWKRAGASPPAVVACDSDAGVLAALCEKHPQLRGAGGDLAAAAGQEVVFLALHPPAVPAAAAEIAKGLRPSAVLVSLAPKLSIAKLSELLGGFARIARAIPNAASIVGRGYNPVSYGSALSEADREALRDLLSPLGRNPEVPEADLETYAIVTAMGPTYLWPQLYELESLAESFGLAQEQAQQAVEAMLAGAVATMHESGLAPAEVEDLVPVKPLAEEQPALLAAYRTRLSGLREKLRA